MEINKEMFVQFLVFTSMGFFSDRKFLNIENIENSRIREYVKIELKFLGNVSFFDNGLTKKGAFFFPASGVIWHA